MIALSVTYPSTKLGVKKLSPGDNLLAVGASVPIGSSAIVTVWGRNDMPTRQQLGMRWEVRDPDGLLVEQYPGGGAIDWEFGYTGPGDEQDFIGGRFDLDKAGTYTVAVELMMNPDNPVVVDSYDGDLCAVTTEIPPAYELVYHHEYPEAKTYVGVAEECTATLTIPLPDQLFPNSWVIEKIADTFADEVAKEGGEMLDIKIYEDATPTWQTDYIIVASAIASPLPWALIIPLILAIILVVAFIKLVVEFKDIDWGEIPAPIPWAILVLVGGLAVAGAGVAFALSRPKPKEAA